MTGKTLIEWGFQPGRWFPNAIEAANRMRQEGVGDDAIFVKIQEFVPAELSMRTNNIPYGVFLDAETQAERDNLAGVNAHMDALMRVPTILAGSVMPDACPSGSQAGTIPVGGVVATKNAIHPGFHSADICCSMAVSLFKREDDPKRLLDAVQAVTHFGPVTPQSPRKTDVAVPAYWAEADENPFLKGLGDFAKFHFATQGDGNHFAYVGKLASTGQLALVTHHGSRGLGAQLYKRGIAAAKRHTAIKAPKVPGHNAWIEADSDEGRAYWSALQFVRQWTRDSHYAIHDMASQKLGNAVSDRFWNEHNFVFRKTDGLYYHGKGATPSWKGFSPDDVGYTLIPLNMSQPILVTSHRDNKGSLGFAPHGAGRNASRTQHMREGGDALKTELAELQAGGLDVRSYCGVPDHSELPSAYKNAKAVRSQIEKYDLAKVEDQILPYGSIMAGDWEKDAPWKVARQAKLLARKAIPA
ncbi:RtcB family protein [Methylobacterium sp. WL120]|nr:RtcB family protein [Methylobacterium sp. WL120]